MERPTIGIDTPDVLYELERLIDELEYGTCPSNLSVGEFPSADPANIRDFLDTGELSEAEKQLSQTTIDWDVYGEGEPVQFNAFAEMLNRDSIGRVATEGVQPGQVGEAKEFRPVQPADVLAEGEEAVGMPMARSLQKPRGKHLFTRVTVSAGDMVRIQAKMGEDDVGELPYRFMLEGCNESRVRDYASRFADGEYPHEFVVLMESDGSFMLQEGRHRALAAYEAGVDEVSALVTWETDPKRFQNPSHISRYEQ